MKRAGTQGIKRGFRFFPIPAVVVLCLFGAVLSGQDLSARGRRAAKNEQRAADVAVRGGANGTRGPAVSQLVDRIAASQEQCANIDSYILKWQVTGVGRCSFMGRGRRKIFEYTELLVDGDKFRRSEKEWGHCIRGEDIFITEEDPRQRNWLWDGKYSYFWAKTPAKWLERLAARRYTNAEKRARFLADRAGYVKLEAGRGGKRTDGSIAADLKMGFLQGDVERIDKILRKADNISLRDTPEQVGASECFVVDAVAKSGRYALWIDPEHGYNIAQAKVLKGPSQIKIGAWGIPETIEYSLENMRFQMVGGMWVPVEADQKYNERYASGDFMETSTHRRRTEVVLDPNHEALHSFLPDIPAGWQVKLNGFRRIDSSGRFYWKDGKVTDETGAVVELEPAATGPAASKVKPESGNIYERPR